MFIHPNMVRIAFGPSPYGDGKMNQFHTKPMTEGEGINEVEEM
jgi:hypothetical protein